MVVRVFLYVVGARKRAPLSSGPELELGLLPALDDGRFDPSDWWPDPGREPGRDPRLPGLDNVCALDEPVS